MADDQVPAHDDSRSDLDSVQSLAEFAQACDRLRAGRSYAELRKAARPRSLPGATLSNLLNAKTTPTRETVCTLLFACGLHDDAAQRPWLAAWERVATAHQPRPAGAERVRHARPRLLGVHAAIQIPGAAGELPAYVPRDLDADLRAALTAAAAHGGFVLLVGGSSVGKTRALYEAIQAHLSEWWLLHLADAAAIADHAAAPTQRTVLWLDELQRYLNHPAGLPAGILRQLITAGTVVVATLWPDEYSMRTTRPPAGQPDPYANDRDLLRLAHTIRVPDTLTLIERRRGETLAPTDQRIRIALDATDAGFTQVLAAGPALIQHWEQATDCYGKAVISAALDARRVGAHHPATRDFLEAAAPTYLTPSQQATAPSDWLDWALSYATRPLHGAASALAPVPAGMGRIAGYIVADYLHQHARRVRRTVPLPDPVWQALVDHHHPSESLRLARSARRRGRYSDAISFYDHAVSSAVSLADIEIVGLLPVQEGPGKYARDPLQVAKYAAEMRRLLVWESNPDDGVIEGFHRVDLRERHVDPEANERMIAWLQSLVETDDTETLRAELLARQGRVDEAIILFRPLAEAGYTDCQSQLIELLAKNDRLEDLRAEVHAGTPFAAAQLWAITHSDTRR